jgi:hypothetical protein
MIQHRVQYDQQHTQARRQRRLLGFAGGAQIAHDAPFLRRPSPGSGSGQAPGFPTHLLEYSHRLFDTEACSFHGTLLPLQE